MNVSNKGDLRVKRTHKLLWQALLDLLLKEGKMFNAITVNRLCEKAMVHRTTFYKHFEDKYDLLFMGLAQFNEDYAKHSLKDRIENPFQTMAKTPHSELFYNIMHTQKNDEVFSKYVNQHIQGGKKLDFIELNQKGKNFTVPIEIVAEFYSGMVSSLSTWWIRNNREFSAEQMDQYFHELVNKEFFSVTK